MLVEGNGEMKRNAEARTELFALVQMTKAALMRDKSRMVLCDEGSTSLYSLASVQPKSPSKIFSAPIKKAAASRPVISPIPKQVESVVHEETIEPSRPKGDMNRLLPRSFGAAVTDTSAIRDAMAKIEGMPHLSASPMYSGVAKRDSSQWVICSYIGAQESSERASFIEAVTKAIQERLLVATTSLSCEDLTFTQLFPMVLDDSEVVVFFVDQHLEQKLRESLRTISSYDPTPYPIAAPFITLGTLHKKPLRAILMNKNTHEDQVLKQQLWASIRGLASEGVKSLHSHN